MLAKRVEYKNQIYFQSLIGHIEDCLKILKNYFDLKGNVIQNFCNRFQIEIEKFYQDLFLSVALHDIGKLTQQFQKNIKEGKRSHKYPHPLFGIPILLEIPFNKYENYPLPILAILAHHSQLHKSIYDGYNLSRRVTYFEQHIIDFVNKDISMLYAKIGFDRNFYLQKIKIDSFEHWTRDDIRGEFIEKYILEVKNKFLIKSIYTYLLSILQLCDDFSSAYFNRFVERSIPDKEIIDSVITETCEFVYDIESNDAELKEILFKDFVPYKFQNKLNECNEKFIFLFASCGRGKTEAALSWAFKLKNVLHRDKIIFALPTQVTCNAMYDRLVDTYGFGEKNVGLFHGKSLIKLKYRQKDKKEIVLEDGFSSDEDIDYKSYDILKDDVFKGNVFFKPITVTTIDHLAYSFVHGFSQADFACGNLQNAIIIFDEVHYYEQHTLNILLRLFSILRKMEIPHLLMTGTAPEFLIKELKNNYKFIKDTEGLEFKPFIISKKKEEDILNSFEVYEAIKNDYDSKKSIFVIFNQVEWAQNFYKELKSYLKNTIDEPNIILYHSRFIHKDRVRKEKEIRKKSMQKPCILVTTQVIEISLDISCDVMFTTIAPPDAIGQRAGRINRSGKFYQNGSTYYVVKLFNVDNHQPYPDKIIEDSWKYFKEGPYSYEEIKNVCDKVYSTYELVKDKKYFDYFKKNILFGDHYKDITYGDDEGKSLKIRSDDFQQISVVPSSIYDEAEQLVSEKKAIWAEYEVKIPYYKVQNDIREHGDLYNFHKNEVNRTLECDFMYNFELGIQFNKTYKRIKII